jgi:predicted transglutaminase-like cysteine proteinase
MKLTVSSVALCMLICVAAQPADSRPGDGGDNVLPPLGHTFFCMRYPNDCARTDSTGALPVSLDDRWHKMNLVNASVNAAITPKSDPDHLHTHWLIAPLEATVTTSRSRNVTNSSTQAGLHHRCCWPKSS